jgi:hypothetical protein
MGGKLGRVNNRRVQRSSVNNRKYLLLSLDLAGVLQTLSSREILLHKSSEKQRKKFMQF